VTEPSDPPILVLVEPQDLVNIASAIRVAKNFGLTDVRLVNPREFDAWRVEGIAHNTGDILARLRITATLDEALADTAYVVALTARERRAKRSMLRPRAAAQSLVERSADGPVAFVAGREDKGLTNDELDRCHAMVTIPTDPGYRSLNLAQAICVMCYETMLARHGLDVPVKPPRRRADQATADQHERLFERFFRGDDARAVTDAGGAGLGLAIARWIARAHGGDVTLAESAPDRCTFRLAVRAG